jgi:hypothetical protein
LAAEKDTKTPILASKKKHEALRFYATMAAISSNGLWLRTAFPVSSQQQQLQQSAIRNLPAQHLPFVRLSLVGSCW